MAYGDNQVIALFEPADDLTAAVTGAIGAGKFVKIGGNFQAGPALDVSTPTGPLTGGNLMQVSLCGAGQKAFGVTKWETAAANEVVGLYTGNQVVPMTAGGTITAGNEVMANASGDPVAWTSAASEANKPLGIAVSGAASSATVYVKLYA
jgi:hypothetical protein